MQISDLRYIVRRLARTPMFTAVAIATIAIGIGANTAIFSVVDGVLLKPLPYAEADRLVSIKQTAIGIPDLATSEPEYFTFREENRTFQEYGVWRSGFASITGLDTPEQVQRLSMTPGLLRALNVQPMLGRSFTERDDSPGSPETAILTYSYWRRRFGGDPSVIGRHFRVAAEPAEIIGVMPKSFQFLDEKADIIFPFQLDPTKSTITSFAYRSIARLKPGVTIAQANADVARMIPMGNTNFLVPQGFDRKVLETAHIQPRIVPLKEDVVGDLRKVLWLLMGSIGVVLLIACANMANLLLARAEARQQELAVRAALGASARQIGQELLMESLFLGVLGGAAGLVVANAALRLLVSIAPTSLPRLENIALDPPAIVFATGISLVAGFAFGLLPVFRYAGAGVSSALRAGGRTMSQSKDARRTRNSLVVFQVALSVILLISSGLMLRTFEALRKVDPGFTHPQELQTLTLFIPDAQVREPIRVIRMFDEIRRRIGDIRGVDSAGFSSPINMDGRDNTTLLYAQDRTYAEGEFPPLRNVAIVAPDFFKTMGTTFIAGRDFTWTEIYTARKVAMISESTARDLWGDPAKGLGKRIRVGSKDPWYEVIGVVKDIHYDGLDKAAPSTVYWPVIIENPFRTDLPTFAQRRAEFVIRSSRAGSVGLLADLQKAVWSVSPDLPLASVATMDEVSRSSMARSSFTLIMIGIAGGMALLLGVVGIYGAISYSVSRRTREMGIRIALGARPDELQQMVVGNGLLLAAVGVALGLLAATGMTRVMGSLLFGVSATDPLTYASVAVVLLVVAAAASYLPAHRASSVNPVDALRAE